MKYVTLILYKGHFLSLFVDVKVLPSNQLLVLTDQDMSE